MRSSALVAAVLMTAPAAAAHDAMVELRNGIHVYFAVEGPPPSGHSVSGQAGDMIARGFTDAASCTYFGYGIAARPAAKGRIEVHLGALTPEAEEELREHVVDSRGAKCAAAQAVTPVPRFPPPTLLADGEGLSIDLLTNPSTGATLTERIRVSRRAIVVPELPGPVRELRLEDLPLGVTPRGRILIDGKEEANQCGSRGTLIYFFLPKRQERFVFSLVPRDGFDFRKVGLGDVDRITFSWEGTRYQWIGEEPVVGPGLRFPVWVLKDDQDPPLGRRGDGLACGAETPESLLRKRSASTALRGN